jgi:hypothetical protein
MKTLGSVYIGPLGKSAMYLRLGFLCIVLATVPNVADAQSVVIQLLATALQGAQEFPERDPEKARLAQRNVFNSIPKRSGVRFVVVSDELRFAYTGTKLELASAGTIILFASDSYARIPEPIARQVSICPEGWATLQYLSNSEPRYESFEVVCGLGAGESKSIVTRAPETPGEYQGAAKVLRINYLEASLESLDVNNDGTNVATIRLKNVGASGVLLGLAFKAMHSDNIADFWKFNPILEGRLSDNAGNSFPVVGASGLPFGKSLTDWAFIRTGEEREATITFSGSGRPGSAFNLMFGIWLGYRDANGSQTAPSMFTIRFNDIRPRRS